MYNYWITAQAAQQAFNFSYGISSSQQKSNVPSGARHAVFEVFFQGCYLSIEVNKWKGIFFTKTLYINLLNVNKKIFKKIFDL